MANKTYASAVKAVEQALNQQVAIPSDVVAGTFSMESASVFKEQAGDSLSSQIALLSDALTQSGFHSDLSLESAASWDEMSNDHKIASVLLAATSSQESMRSYHSAGLTAKSTPNSVSLESVYSGFGGELERSELGSYSQESFDVTALNGMRGANVVFNMIAARQSAFTEAFFRTEVLTNAESGLSITVERTEVIDYAKHKSATARLDLNRRNLLDSVMDRDILEPSNSTDLVPWVNPDGSNDEVFVAEGLVGTRIDMVGGVAVDTRPLKLGESINIIAASNNPATIENGQLDYTDQISPGSKVTALYATLGTDVFKLDTNNTIRNQFKKSQEGAGREISLNMNVDSYSFPVKTIAGVESTELGDLVVTPKRTAIVSFTVTGTGNVESGLIELVATKVRLQKLLAEDGTQLSLTSGEGKALADKFKTAELFGFDFKAKRSNSNWRSIGTLIDVTPYTESYNIDYMSPISVLSPTSDNNISTKLNGMLQAARRRNDQQALGVLENYFDHLMLHRDALRKGERVDIIGIGRYLVKPYVRQVDVKVAERLVNVSSHVRGEDIQKILVDDLRDVVSRAAYFSNYTYVLDAVSPGAKPEVVIGADPIVARYLNIIADERLLGDDFRFTVVTHPDRNLQGKIYISFKSDIKGLGFGIHAYIPELIQKVTATLGGSGATINNDRIIPRNMHIPTLPIMVRMDVSELRAAIVNNGLERDDQ